MKKENIQQKIWEDLEIFWENSDRFKKIRKGSKRFKKIKKDSDNIQKDSMRLTKILKDLEYI